MDQAFHMQLIKDELSPPLKWNLGRITQIHPGSDRVTKALE